MDQETKNRMDGLVNQKTMEELIEKVNYLKTSFLLEGFEDSEIREYIKDIIRGIK